MASIDQRVGVGVGVIVERDGEILLGKRIHDKHGKGEYSLPGGKPDPGEDPATAALRELREETGLVAEDARPLGVWTYDRYEDYGVHTVCLYFLVDVGDQEPVNLEPEKCESWNWYEAEDLPVPLFSGVTTAIRALGYW